MAQTHPGAYVLYKEPNSNEPSWPGVVYVDEFAPQNIQKSRPGGYVTLILLLREPYRFRWATTNQLSPLVSIQEAGLSVYSEDLRHAYETARFLKDTKVGLEYWKKEVETQYRSSTLQDVEPEDTIDYESDVDEELREALRISHEAYYSSTPQNLSTASRSPPKRSRRQCSILISDDEDMGLYSSPPPKNRARSSPKRSRPSRFQNDLQNSLSRISTNDELPRKAINAGPSIVQDNAGLATQKKKVSSQFSSGTPLDRLFELGSLGRRSSAPISDVIEGDISESRDFIQVRIGPELEVLSLQKEDVWNRPYFRDSRTGVNHFTLNEDNQWELRHPHLVNIEPVDFQFVAEYLTDSDFGLRQPEGQEQMKEAIAQCVSAWEIGEKLGMDDLLEHIGDKVKFLEWDNEDVLTLAILVYRTSGPSLHAHEVMRDWISGFLAHHFWTYIKDETTSNYFRKRLRRLPELERDVFVKRAQSLTTGAEPDEDEESDEGEL